jgi:hypothetical protein
LEDVSDKISLLNGLVDLAVKMPFSSSLTLPEQYFVAQKDYLIARSASLRHLRKLSHAIGRPMLSKNSDFVRKLDGAFSYAKVRNNNSVDLSRFSLDLDM